jgi:hypothetical protein
VLTRASFYRPKLDPKKHAANLAKAQQANRLARLEEIEQALVELRSKNEDLVNTVDAKTLLIEELNVQV